MDAMLAGVIAILWFGWVRGLAADRETRVRMFWILVAVGVEEGVLDAVAVGVFDGVGDADGVFVTVGVGVAVLVGVIEGVFVAVGVRVSVGVGVEVGNLIGVEVTSAMVKFADA